MIPINFKPILLLVLFYVSNRKYDKTESRSTRQVNAVFITDQLLVVRVMQ